MPPAAVAGLAAAGALAGGIGANKQRKRQNAYLGAAARKLDPNAIMQSSEILNPYLMQALSGQTSDQPMSGYGQSLFNLAQNPGYIDPQVMNMPFHLSAQRQNQDLQRAQSILGKTQSGSMSGLGNAYTLANAASRTARDVGTAQQYALWRAQQQRADIQMLQQMLAQTQGIASGNAQQQANMLQNMQAGQGAFGMGSNMITGALGAYAPFAQQRTGTPAAAGAGAGTRGTLPPTFQPPMGSGFGSLPSPFQYGGIGGQGGQPFAGSGLEGSLDNGLNFDRGRFFS